MVISVDIYTLYANNINTDIINNTNCSCFKVDVSLRFSLNCVFLIFIAYHQVCLIGWRWFFFLCSAFSVSLRYWYVSVILCTIRRRSAYRLHFHVFEFYLLRIQTRTTYTLRFESVLNVYFNMDDALAQNI